MPHVKVQILPNAKEAEYATVAPINNFVHSLFIQMDIFFNETLVSSPKNTYQYRAYIETLLNYSQPALILHLTSGLLYADTPGCMDTTVNIAHEMERPLT